MTNDLLKSLRAYGGGDLQRGLHLMGAAADEIERLNKKCGALAYLLYGSSGPDDPWQAKMDEVTKPLHAEIERLQQVKSAFAHDAAMYASRLPNAHEPSDGPHRAFLEMPEGYSGPVKVSNPGAPVAEVTVYPSQGASRDASSEQPLEKNSEG